MKRFAAFALAVVTGVSLMSTVAFAADGDNFVPSATKKGAPELVEQKDEDGNSFVAQIVNGDEVIANIPASDVNITAYADRESAGETIHAALAGALEDVQGASDLSNLNSALTDVAKVQYPDYAGYTFTVTDLFDITISENYQDMLNSNDSYEFRVWLETGIEADVQAPIVMHRDATKNWLVLTNDNVTNLGNGTMLCDFNGLCPVIFVSVKESSKAAPTSADFPAVPVATVLVLVSAATVCATMALKKKEN